ncbi:MAG TPA: DUF5050 domain-containing protein [Candidatus Borkfalkia stercoripullorum]|nr:DUF5050 domain-containing protein [Candidatus Borkfalkia stercoripullorum]
MKKKLITILIILAAVCALGTGALTAHAENGKANGGNAETRLLLPSSYEQYLELESPSDFAVSERYIAVADKDIIYVYDKSDSIFATYTHTASTSTLSSLNFYENGGSCYLLFVDSNTNIYYIDCGSRADDDTFSSTSLDFTCASFIIQGETLYYSRTTSGTVVYRTAMSLSSLAEGETIEQDATTSITPYFSMSGNEVYFSLNSRIYLITENGAAQEYRSVSSSITAFSVTDDKIFYSTTGSDRDFLVYQNQMSQAVQYNGDSITGVPSVKLVGNDLWFIENQNIRLLDPFAKEGYSFLDYTIGKYADIENRIGQNASDISLNGDTVVIADTSNSRILLAHNDSNGGSYTSIETDAFSPMLVCAGESDFAVADGGILRIYSYNGSLVRSYDALTTSINGIAYSYGNYYVTAESQSFIYVYDAATDLPESKSVPAAGNAITADIYGNLYILSGTAVYELNVLSENIFDGNIIYTAPAQTNKILSDFAGNLYAQTDGGIYLLNSGGNTSVFAPASLAPLVYYDGTPTVESFAFSFESGEVYILSDGFIAVTEKIGVSSLDHLSSQDENGKKAYDTLYTDALTADSYTALQLVAVPAQSVAISLDFQGLDQSSDSLPYESYSKTAEERTGVVLARTVNGPIVGFFTRTEDPDSDVNVVYAYEVALILDTDDTLAYSDAAQENAAQSASVVENVGIYKYPQMRLGSNAVSSSEDYTDFLCIGRLEKGAQISLLARVDGAHLDSDYYFVSASVGGETVYGYIPASFAVQYGEAGGGAGGAEYRYARLDRGKSVTLYHTSANTELILSDEEELKIYYNNKDEHGNVYAVYETETGTYAGYIDPDCLYEATPIVMVTLALVLVVAAALIVSVCYLILRKQPTLQP